MKIPEGEKVVTNKHLTAIRAISQLHDRFIDCDGGLKDQVKDTLKEKGAKYAQNDLATARLQPGGKTRIDPTKLHALIAAGKITLDQFLSLVTVNGDKLKLILSGEQISEISSWQAYATPSLYIDWKDGVIFDADALIGLLEQRLAGSTIAKGADKRSPARKRRAG